jgi:hypothetical protein
MRVGDIEHEERETIGFNQSVGITISTKSNIFLAAIFYISIASIF